MENYKLVRKYIFSEVSCVQHEDYKYISILMDMIQKRIKLFTDICL